MIDLHMHSTASDGRCSPTELVSRAASAGLTTIALTDHDTVGGCREAAAAASATGIAFVPGIEVTAIRSGGDVHVLGYFVDVDAPSLQSFLAGQRQQRIDRIREIVSRLRAHGIDLDAEAILQPGLQDATKAAGRPWIARALVAHGHVASTQDAFDTWLAQGRPAFVPRAGATPEEAFAQIHRAGGVASLAHPGLLDHDEWIPEFAAAGVDAIEVYHSEHDEAMTTRYLSMARQFGLGISGGSDYHADEAHDAVELGAIALPRADFDDLARRRRSPSPARRV